MKPRLNAGMFLYTQQNQENSNFTEIAKLFQATKQLWFYCLSRDVTRQRSLHTVAVLVTTVKPGNYTGTISFVFGAVAFAQQNSSPLFTSSFLCDKRDLMLSQKKSDVSVKEKKKLLLVMCVNGCSWHTWTQERWEPNKTFHFLKKKRGKRGVATTFHHLGIRRTHTRVGRWSIEMIKSVIIFCTVDQGL